MFETGGVAESRRRFGVDGDGDVVHLLELFLGVGLVGGGGDLPMLRRLFLLGEAEVGAVSGPTFRHQDICLARP